PPLCREGPPLHSALTVSAPQCKALLPPATSAIAHRLARRGATARPPPCTRPLRSRPRGTLGASAPFPSYAFRPRKILTPCDSAGLRASVFILVCALARVTHFHGFRDTLRVIRLVIGSPFWRRVETSE